MATIPKSHNGRTGSDTATTPPPTVAPCGVYFDCLPDAIAFLKRSISQMETDLLNPFLDEESRAYQFSLHYLPKFRARLSEYVRDLANAPKQEGE